MIKTDITNTSGAIIRTGTTLICDDCKVLNVWYSSVIGDIIEVSNRCNIDTPHEFTPVTVTSSGIYGVMFGKYFGIHKGLDEYLNAMFKYCEEYDGLPGEHTLDDIMRKYETVNHPKHYNKYDVEAIDMMIRIWGYLDAITFCKLNAYKYRMRAGSKPNISIEEDFKKEAWYLEKAKEISRIHGVK